MIWCMSTFLEKKDKLLFLVQEMDMRALLKSKTKTKKTKNDRLLSIKTKRHKNDLSPFVITQSQEKENCWLFLALFQSQSLQTDLRVSALISSLVLLNQKDALSSWFANKQLWHYRVKSTLPIVFDNYQGPVLCKLANYVIT